MKPGIHPTYHRNAKVTCACGHTFVTGSVLPAIHVEICSKCHPFFTGVKRFVDTEGRLQKFERRRREAKYEAKKKITTPSAPAKVKTLKEMLGEVK